MDGYFIGGLEYDAKDDEATTVIGGTTYITSGKFKTSLRDAILDWGTFLEVYDKSLDCRTLFDQVVKILDINKDNLKETTKSSNLSEYMLPLVSRIYKLPLDMHMACLLKQFMLYEPVSIAIHSIFVTLKQHFEELVERFIQTRNDYLSEHKGQGKPNNWGKLMKTWSKTNIDDELDTSSLTLFFVSPPKPYKSKIKFKVKDHANVIKTLTSALKKFKYPGFCPKVPHKRLLGLLTFPVKELSVAIKALDPKFKIPDYNKIETKMKRALASQPKKPDIPKLPDRKKAPNKLVAESKLKAEPHTLGDAQMKARMDLTKWYVRQILELRKNLMETGKKFETYYRQKSEVLTQVNTVLREYLHLKITV